MKLHWTLYILVFMINYSIQLTLGFYSYKQEYTHFAIIDKHIRHKKHKKTEMQVQISFL